MGTRSLILAFALTSARAWSAGCCGGGGGLPTLITGDYRAQFSASATNSTTTHQANEKAQIRGTRGADQTVSETLSFAGAYQLTEYLQAGLTLPSKLNTRRTARKTESTFGMGDIRLQMAYEFLPELGYSLWKPRGFVFVEQTVPVSKSTYDAKKPLRTDVMGNGFYTTSAGVSFFKNFTPYDGLFMAEIHRGFDREFDAVKVSPGWGGSALIGGGRSYFQDRVRLGATLMHALETGNQIHGFINSKAKRKYFWELGLAASYKLERSSLSLSYRDQAFLGYATNTMLSKTLGLSYTHFIEL